MLWALVFFQQFGASQAIFNTIDSKNPDIFLNLGDFIYSDDYLNPNNPHNEDWEAYLTSMYRMLFDSATFQNFKSKYTIHSTWDDHDFGMNNAAGDFVNKQLSKKVFLMYGVCPKVVSAGIETEFMKCFIMVMRRIGFNYYF